jgi:hypothetical protein
MGWDGSERRTPHRRAHRSLTCIERSLKLDPIPPEATLEAMRDFMQEQWMPHLEREDTRDARSAEDHEVLQQAKIWMKGGCYFLRVILPSLVMLCSALAATVLWIRHW